MTDTDLERLNSAAPSKLADAVGVVLTPAVLVSGLLAYVTIRHTPDLTSALKWLALAALFIVAVPYAILRLLHRRGGVDDLQVVRRSQRPKLFVMASICTGLGLALLRLLGAPTQLIALVIAMLAGLASMLIVTLRWKASMHLAVLGGTLAILAHEQPVAALLLSPTAPLLAWSRVRAGRHSWGQVTAGALIGAVVAYAVYGALTQSH